MKLLTLNTHSLIEADYEDKLRAFVEFVLREQPDLMAMQEVNQSMSAPEAGEELRQGLVSLPGMSVPVRNDNHAARVAHRLRNAGMDCAWAWLPVKRGYERFDEGVAILAPNRQISESAEHLLTAQDDYFNWKTRKILGVRLNGLNDWFYTVHMGWWNDETEPFSAQWTALQRAVDGQKNAPVWLMGDFNSPAEHRGEGYDLMREMDWHDAWTLAGHTDGCATVPGQIDGWRESTPGKNGLRMDQIWCSQAVPVKEMRVVLDGRREKQVSDHFGLLLEQ